MQMQYLLQQATPQDAFHVALIMAEAIGDDIMERYAANGGTLPAKDIARMELLTEVARRTDTLYSYTHCTLARTPEGEIAGGLIAYPGDDYQQYRRTTFSLVQELLTFDPEKMDPETLPGEFYLDSIAVFPRFRGQGIARQLLLHGIALGQTLHYPTILACAPENAGAHALYTSLGFRDTTRLFIFGEDYIRMEHSF